MPLQTCAHRNSAETFGFNPRHHDASWHLFAPCQVLVHCGLPHVLQFLQSRNLPCVEGQFYRTPDLHVWWNKTCQNSFSSILMAFPLLTCWTSGLPTIFSWPKRLHVDPQGAVALGPRHGLPSPLCPSRCTWRRLAGDLSLEVRQERIRTRDPCVHAR